MVFFRTHYTVYESSIYLIRSVRLTKTKYSIPPFCHSLEFANYLPCRVVSCKWHWTASDGESHILQIWRQRSTPALPFVQGTLWPILLVHVRVSSMDQMKLIENYSYFIAYLIPYNCKLLVLRIQKTKLVTLVEGDPNAPFSIATTQRGCYSIR